MDNEKWEYIKRKVQTIGMQTFAEYYYELQKSTKQEILNLLEKNSNWAPGSIQAKASAGIDIFKERISKEALELIISSNSSQKAIERATEIYAKEYPEEELKKIRFVRPEFEFGTQIIENLFSDYEVIAQYDVLGSKLDWYVPELKLAIEFDEKHHKRNKKDDSQRQKSIENYLGCKFLRYSF